MENGIKQAPKEIKVQTRKFQLKKGKILLGFRLQRDRGKITGLSLVQRNARVHMAYPFLLKRKEKKDHIQYDAVIDLSGLPLEVAFWDVVATVETKGEKQEAILGGLSAKLKLSLILFPRWTKTKDGHLIYPFVNGARQFTIQYRKYDKKYDSIFFLCKEYLALFCYFLFDFNLILIFRN